MKRKKRSQYTPGEDQMIVDCVASEEKVTPGIRKAAALLNRTEAGVYTRFTKLRKDGMTPSGDLSPNALWKKRSEKPKPFGANYPSHSVVVEGGTVRLGKATIKGNFTLILG